MQGATKEFAATPPVVQETGFIPAGRSGERPKFGGRVLDRVLNSNTLMADGGMVLKAATVSAIYGLAHGLAYFIDRGEQNNNPAVMPADNIGRAEA